MKIDNFSNKIHRESLKFSHLIRSVFQPRAVQYVGYVGRKNFGDELLFDIFREICDLPVIANLDTYAFYRSRKSKVVIGGGTVIGGCIYAKALAKLQRPVLTFASGVIPGSINDDWVGILSESRNIVRSSDSAAAIECHGLASEAFVDPGIFSELIYNTKRVVDNNYIVLAPHGDFDHCDFYRNIADNFGEKIFFFASHPSDLKQIKKICPEMNNVILGWVDIKRSVGIISNADLVVSTRLHPAVCAASAKVPFYILKYEQKQLEFAQSIGLESRVIDGVHYFDAKSISKENNLDWSQVEFFLNRFNRFSSEINDLLR